MKKHNEGYTLPLVMVVLLVLAIVAVTIMTTSLKNMQRQQGFIETMKAQYAAQGEIEKIVAQLEKGIEVLVPFKDNTADIDETEKTVTGVIVAEQDGVTIECGIEISASDAVSKDQDSGKIKLSGEIAIKYTSYEIIKGGAAQ